MPNMRQYGQMASSVLPLFLGLSGLAVSYKSYKTISDVQQQIEEISKLSKNH